MLTLVCVDRVEIIENFTKLFIEDQRFLAFMKCCLDVGNLINLGTRRGGAYGYKFASFKSFGSCKSNNGKVYLMPYLIDKICDQYPDILDFYPDLNNCITGAMTFDFDDVITNLGTLKSKLGTLKTLLESSEKMNPPDKSFIDQFSEFFSANITPCIQLEEKTKTVKEKFLETCVKLGDDMKKIKGEKSSVIVGEYKKIFVEFGRSIDTINKKKEKELKEKKKKDKRASKPKGENID